MKHLIINMNGKYSSVIRDRPIRHELDNLTISTYHSNKLLDILRLCRVKKTLTLESAFHDYENALQAISITQAEHITISVGCIEVL